MIKVIAIGNTLMSDDGIAIKVVDNIHEDLEKLGIKCVKAETDFNFALDNIECGDFIFIVDSTLFNLNCGQITQISLNKVDKYSKHLLSAHNMNLIWLINNMGVDVKGIILGIEIHDIKFGIKISDGLERKFSEICNAVFRIIKEKSLECYKEGKSNA
ncbi:MULTISPECIES: hydrogenase maturation protease [Clostridium]|uniref:Hydrogenase maturation protease n=1 Tax=Clostridium cibarium TaxID=2762247 RepID=A0ABR8PRM3_9CLOT|nr:MULTISPECIES: hydrogenase maturation protease [Clostridium]MBD7910829.1 hydrogenase maturation protease [Clostridium cibarium]